MKLFHLAPLARAVCLAPAILSAAPENYKIDPVHSSVTFKIKHMNVSNVHGRFNKMEGAFTYDKEDAANNKLELTIDTDSLDTANAKRDEHVKGPDFLNVKQFPKMTYKSTSIKKLSDNEFEVTGDLTMHGQTKPVTAKLQKIGEASDPKGVHRAGGESTFTLKRSDFGMDKMQNALGDEVTVTVAVEGIRQDAK
jgi:polyisoprenoid-binding protein YceI